VEARTLAAARAGAATIAISVFDALWLASSSGTERIPYSPIEVTTSKDESLARRHNYIGHSTHSLAGQQKTMNALAQVAYSLLIDEQRLMRGEDRERPIESINERFRDKHAGLRSFARDDRLRCHRSAIPRG
jgi:hypothetical protein